MESYHFATQNFKELVNNSCREIHTEFIIKDSAVRPSNAYKALLYINPFSNQSIHLVSRTHLPAWRRSQMEKLFWLFVFDIILTLDPQCQLDLN